MSLNNIVVLSKKAILLLLLVSLSACATMERPLTGIIPGREVETLQSAIGISAESGERSVGGRGYLIFKQPDRAHLAVLSPFGAVMMEVFSGSDHLTCLFPSKQTAYSGLLSELPENSALRSLGMMKWVMAPPPVVPSPGTREVIALPGDRYYFDRNGLLVRKVSEQGVEVAYDEYRSLDGVAFPGTIVIGSHGATVKIVFEEPQLNLPVEDATLTPDLKGVSVLPLAQFKGF